MVDVDSLALVFEFRFERLRAAVSTATRTGGEYGREERWKEFDGPPPTAPAVGFTLSE